MLYSEPADSNVGPSLVTVADAAKILGGKKPADVDRLIQAGEIASERRTDGRRVVDLASLNDYREQTEGQA